MVNDKDQKTFIKHCKDCLGQSYMSAASLAKINAEKAIENEPIEHKKNNAGKRAGNLTLLAELKAIGCEKWRPDKDGNKPKPRHLPRQPLTQQERENIGAKSGNMPSKYKNKILRDAGVE